MKLFVTLTRKSLTVVFAAVIVFILTVLRFFTADPSKPDGSANELRISYIESLGLSAEASAEVAEEVTVPQSFSEVYTEYNRLQKQAGFDLSDYKGKKVMLYTYPLSRESQMLIHLLVYDGCIIGGDIDSYEPQVKMKPLLPI